MAAAYRKTLYCHDLQPEEDYGNLDQDSRDLNLRHDRYAPLHCEARYPTGIIRCSEQKRPLPTSRFDDSMSAKFSPVDWKMGQVFD
jgi:hypothetical protein